MMHKIEVGIVKFVDKIKHQWTPYQRNLRHFLYYFNQEVQKRQLNMIQMKDKFFVNKTGLYRKFRKCNNNEIILFRHSNSYEIKTIKIEHDQLYYSRLLKRYKTVNSFFHLDNLGNSDQMLKLFSKNHPFFINQKYVNTLLNVEDLEFNDIDVIINDLFETASMQDNKPFFILTYSEKTLNYQLFFKNSLGQWWCDFEKIDKPIFRPQIKYVWWSR